jgi:hypothetical protein
MIEHPCPFYIRTHSHKGRVMILEEAVSYTLEGEASGGRLMPFSSWRIPENRCS